MNTATRIIEANCDSKDENIINDAANLIKEGKFVVLPTETVYGIAVNLEDQNAIERLYQIKGRDKNKPFSIHIADIEDVEKHAKEILPYAWRLMHKIWPGPLTSVLKSKTNGTVGIRMPKAEVTRSIIRETGKPIVMPSANKSGNSAPHNCDGVLRDLKGLVDLIVDCGPTELGKESTVIDLTLPEPKLLRQGAIDFNLALDEAGKKRVLFVCTGNSCRSVMAEYLLKKELEKRKDIEIYSAGISAPSGMGATSETIELLKNDGIDALSHHAKTLNVRMLKEADLILVMSAQHEKSVISLWSDVKNKVYLLREFAKIKDANLDVLDPIGQSYNFYRDVYYQIKEAVLKIAELI